MLSAEVLNLKPAINMLRIMLAARYQAGCRYCHMQCAEKRCTKQQSCSQCSTVLLHTSAVSKPHTDQCQGSYITHTHTHTHTQTAVKAYIAVATKVVESRGSGGNLCCTANDGSSLHLVTRRCTSWRLCFNLRLLNQRPKQAVASAAAKKQPNMTGGL